MSENAELPSITPTETAKPAEPILIAEFEGDYVRDFEGKLPALSMVMPEGYARGTHLKLMVEVRVRNVRYEEKRAKLDERPELVRQHMFALEEIQLLGAYTSEELDPGVGGTAAASVALLDDLGPGLQDTKFVDSDGVDLDF